jgi:hypothetical protein
VQTSIVLPIYALVSAIKIQNKTERKKKSFHLHLKYNPYSKVKWVGTGWVTTVRFPAATGLFLFALGADQLQSPIK